jgi:flagellar biosynthesis protein
MKSMERELKKAIALTYKEGQFAPRVVAKGRGVSAEALVACALEAGVYVHEAPELVSLLMQIDIDKYIPPELYYAVAELLAWIYRLENRDEHLTKPALKTIID